MNLFNKIKKVFNSDDSQNTLIEDNNKNLDVYICYSNQDQSIVDEIVSILEYNNITCWVKSRNLINNDTDEILKVIENAKMMLLIYSNSFIKSTSNFNEVDIAFKTNKSILNFKIDESNIDDRLQYYLGNSHWIAAYPNPKNSYESLIKSMALLLGKNISKPKLTIMEEGLSSDNQDISKNSSNFKYFDSLIHSGVKEIKLNTDITFNEYDLFKYIELDMDNIVIDGNGHSINAKGKNGIFFVSGKNITLKNITLKNAYETKHSGAAIHNFEGTLKLINVNLEGNISKFNGGAVYNTGKIEIMDSYLTENLSQEGNGGVLFNDGGEIKVSNTIISNNDNECNLITISKGLIKILNSTIKDNNTANNLISNNDSLIIEDTCFKNNRSKNLIINNPQSSLTISKGLFNSNHIIISSVHNCGNYCSISKTKFQDILSDNIFYILNEKSLILEEIKINNSTKSILNNGHILIKDSSKDIKEIIEDYGIIKWNIIPSDKRFDFSYLDNLIHSTENNQIELNHDIYLEDYELDYYEGGIELNIDNLIIDGNGNRINGICKSRIFIITGKNITLKNIIFENGLVIQNHDSPYNNYGGALINTSKSNLIIENCTFRNNYSEKEGGVISNRGDLKIKECTFKNNSAKKGSGVIYNNMGKIEISNSILKDNYVKNENQGSKVEDISYGGVINNHKKGILDINTCEIINNKLEGFRCYGGALYNSGVLNIDDSILSNNLSQKNGGMLYNEDGEVIIAHSKLSNNMALNGDGGAIFNRYGKIEMDNCELTNNNAKFDGGGLHNGSDITITHSKISDNNVKNRNGGGIYNKGTLLIKESQLMDNEALINGYSIFNQENGKSYIYNCKIKNNSSENGEVIYSIAEDSLKMENCIFDS